MAVIYETAAKDVREMLAEVMAEHHPVLRAVKARVDVLMAQDLDREGAPTGNAAVKLHGYSCAATIRIVNLKQRTLGQGDALMIIDQERWDAMGEASQRALLDHELSHLQVLDESGGLMSWSVQNKCVEGRPKLDAMSRPRMTMRLHDWQLGGFAEVAHRHGEAALEVRAVRVLQRSDGQYMWDFRGSDESGKRNDETSAANVRQARAVGAMADQVLKGDELSSITISTSGPGVQPQTVTIDRAAAQRIKKNVDRITRDAKAGRVAGHA